MGAGLATFNVREDLIDRLLSTCKKIGGGYDSRGRSPHYGFGRLDAAAAVR
jgi:hypothetical protein